MTNMTNMNEMTNMTNSYREIKAQISELEKQAEKLRQMEVSTVVMQIKAAMEEYGITASDLGFRDRSEVERSTRTPAKIKYREPSTGKTWSGRGKMPKWLIGQNKDQYLV